METTITLGLHGGYIGIMEKKMEATIIYRGFIGIMENKMETLGPFKGVYKVILGLYWDNGK